MSKNQQKNIHLLRKESDLTIEVVILLALGLFMLLFGLLLFIIQTGELPYSPDSTYGLFLVLISFQIITMGKTPFGDLKRSWILIIIGICTAVLGMAACFIPGYLSDYVRILVGIFLFFGGIALLVQLFISEEKSRLWIKTPGVIRQLIVSCGLVYFFSVVSGIFTLFPGITTITQTAGMLILYGISFFYLAICIQKVTMLYPPGDTKGPMIRKHSNDISLNRRFGFFPEVSLALGPALILLMGVLQILLGLLLTPINQGSIPFSPDGQLGLLLVITALMMMAIGDTPVGIYKRSWILIFIGLVFIATGIFSCIVPGILTDKVRLFLGVLNIMSGVVLLARRFLPKLHEIRNPQIIPFFDPPIITRMKNIQTLINIVTIIFGITMIKQDLISGSLNADIIVIMGLLLFVLAYIFQKVDSMDMSPG